MATWTEMEAQAEVELRKLAKEFDEFDTAELAAEDEFSAKLKAAPAEVKAKIQKHIAETRARNEVARSALDNRMTAEIQKMDADLDKLDAQMDAAHDTARADLEARRSTLYADLTKTQTKLQSSLTTQLNRIKSEIDELEKRAASANADARTKITGHLTAMKMQVQATRQELLRLNETRRESWNEHKARVDRALADLKQGVEKAKAEFH